MKKTMENLKKVHREKLLNGELQQTNLSDGTPGPLRIVPEKFQPIDLNTVKHKKLDEKKN